MKKEDDQLDRIDKLLLTASEVFSSKDKAMRWMKRPLRTLNGQTPLQATDTASGYAEALEILERIRHGIFA